MFSLFNEMFFPCPFSGKKRDKERRDRKEKDPFKLRQKKKKKKKKKSKQYCKPLHVSVVLKGFLDFLFAHVKVYKRHFYNSGTNCLNFKVLCVQPDKLRRVKVQRFAKSITF